MMKFVKSIFDFYVFSNVHVALATFSLTKISLMYVDNHSNKFPLFVLFATLLSYNFIRLFRRTEIKSWLYDWITENKLFLYIISIASFLALIYLGFQLQIKTLIALGPFGILTFFYVIPWFKGKTFRTIPGFKLFLISFSWSGITVLLPLLESNVYFEKGSWITFIQRFFFIAAITIPFDILDFNYDSKKLKTVPQVYGIGKAKRIGILFLMLFLGLNLMKTNSITFLRSELIVMLISLLFLVRSSSEQNKYYSAFFVEAIPIIWLLLLYIIK